jgi:hypothetical protein
VSRKKSTRVSPRSRRTTSRRQRPTRKTRTTRRTSRTTRKTTRVKGLKGYVTIIDAKGWRKLLGRYARSIRLRRELYEKYPKGFLLVQKSGNRIIPKYPIVNPRTGKISIKGLIAAAYRAYQNGHKAVFRKALRLLRTKFKVGLKINKYVYTVSSNRLVRLLPKELVHVKVR